MLEKLKNMIGSGKGSFVDSRKKPKDEGQFGVTEARKINSRLSKIAKAKGYKGYNDFDFSMVK